MTMKSLKEIIVDMPIYQKFSFQLFGEPDNKYPAYLSEEAKRILNILFRTDKVDIKCVECNKEYPFDVHYQISKQSFAGNIYKVTAANFVSYYGFDSEKLSEYKVTPPNEDDGIISYVFTCTMKNNHYQTMYLLYHLKDNEVSIRKIGQQPINIDLKTTYSNEYKSVLNKYDAFEDYRHYEQSESRGLLAGACTYLRRILEKMVLCKLKDSSITDKEREKAEHFEEKVKLTQKQFDSDVQGLLNKSYKLLSKGIHELNNNDINEFYCMILEVINIQLESEKETMLREQKIK